MENSKYEIEIQEEKAEEISLRSSDVNEILGRPPSWLVRRGTAVLFLVIIVILVGSGFFSYPDLVRAPVIITKENPPSLLIARTSGRPEIIFRADGVTVNKSDTLAVIENPARYSDIFRLSNYVSFINRSLFNDSLLFLTPLPGNLLLGEVQPPYNDFVTAWNDLRLFLNQDIFENKITALQTELNAYTRYSDNLERQRALAMRDMELGFRQFHRDSMLYVSNVISRAELEKAQTLLLTKHKTLEDAVLNLSDAGITIARLETAIAETRLEKEERHQRLATNLVNSFRQLESSLGAWENRYLLIAPVAGILNYLSVWSNLQEISQGDAVFSIVPEDMGDLYARIVLPFRGAGKVRPGQRVNIKLEGYPFMEFGMVEGRVHSVSAGPVADGFPAVVSLTRGAVTSFGHELEVIRELPGVAEISTDELSLLERLLHPLRHIMKNRTISRTMT